MSTTGIKTFGNKLNDLGKHTSQLEGQKFMGVPESIHPLATGTPYGKGSPQHLLEKTGGRCLIYELVKGLLIKRVSTINTFSLICIGSNT